MFEDRRHAGFELSRALRAHRGRPGALVLGIPKGGVVVASELAARLSLPFDALICAKLRCPRDPTLAMGAAAETGSIFLNPDVPGPERLTLAQLREELRRVHAEIARSRGLYRRDRGFPEVRGRPVILVDDGSVTGASLMAGARALRRLGASPLIIAVPAAPLAVAAALSPHADELAVGEAPQEFTTLARHYRSLEPVSEAEVVALLSGAALAGTP